MRRLLRHRLLRGAEARNLSWLISEYAVRILLVFVVVALVARHLGPAEFATFGLLYTLINLVLPLTDAGLNHLVSRAVLAEEERLETILGTAAGLRVLFCVIGVPVLAGLAVASGSGYPGLLTFAVLAGVLNALSSLAVIDYYFQSQLQARLSVIARTTALVLVAGAQLTLIALDAGLAPFLLTLAVQHPLFGILYYVIYRWRGGISLARWRLDRGYARSLLRRSGRLTGANICNAVSLRAPVIMLANLGTPTQVGLMSAAIRPVDMFSVLPNAAGATLLPRFVRTHAQSAARYRRVLRLATTGFTLAGAALALGFVLAAPLLVQVLYGDEFVGAARVMQMYAPVLIFLYFRGAMSKWLITEQAFDLSLGSQALGAFTALVGGAVALSINASPEVTAGVLVAQAAVASVVSLAVTRRGRTFLGTVIVGWFRREDPVEFEGRQTTAETLER